MRPTLGAMARFNLWPTPLASDWKSHSPAKTATNSRPLREQVGELDGGPLNPPWVAWLMGWPIAHVELPPGEEREKALAERRRLRDLETAKCRSARPPHGASSEGH